MKKLAISVLLLLLCNNAMSADTKSDWRSFGSKPEEDEFLLGLEEEIQWYFEPEQLDSCVEDDLVGCVVGQIRLFESGRYKEDLPPLYIPPEIRDFLDELLGNVSELEDRCGNIDHKTDYPEIEKLAKEWSAHELLEKWKQEREANGGLRVEKQVPDDYKSFSVEGALEALPKLLIKVSDYVLTKN